MLSDYTGDYKTPLEKGKALTLNVERMKILATDIFKTINSLNLSFMKDIFTCKVNSKVWPNNPIVERHIATKYWTKSFTTVVTQTWNTPPETLDLKHVTVNLSNILTHGLGPSVTLVTTKTTSNKHWVIVSDKWNQCQH